MTAILLLRVPRCSKITVTYLEAHSIDCISNMLMEFVKCSGRSKWNFTYVIKVFLNLFRLCFKLIPRHICSREPVDWKILLAAISSFPKQNTCILHQTSEQTFNVTMVTFIHCWLPHQKHSIQFQLKIKNKLHTPMGKPPDCNALPSTKFAKLGIILRVKAYWFRIHPNKVCNGFLYGFKAHKKQGFSVQ